MRLKRFFGGGSDEPPPPPPDEADDGSEGAEEPEGEPFAGDAIDRSWRDRARDVIPGGASTGSKQAIALFGEGTEFGPTHYLRAGGCRIVTPSGRTLLDFTSALGAVTLGYADESVMNAAVRALANGSVSGLSHVSEVELAERLCDVIPCAEQVRFLKTGAEAVAAAVRIARTYTTRRQVVGCGYFGWLDWWTDHPGVPDGAHADFHPVAFDDGPALESAVARAGDDLAAIIIEPVVERLPSAEWMQTARRLCDESGAVLIFDEIKTGFRLRTGGYEEYAGLEPDLATFGKAMANGFPLAAVVGRAAVMEAARHTWISSTPAGEASALAAAAAVLDWYERAEVCEFLWTSGGEMMHAMERAIQAAGVKGVSVAGIAPMWFLRFDVPSHESRFLEFALDEGVLLKRGPYNFPSLAHAEDVIADLERAASTAFVALREDTRA